jgi:cytosine/adenosine deaminase-related metal-dependent hydrolase
MPYGDIGELASRVVAAAQTSGIGLTLLPVFYAHAGFGGRAPDQGQLRFINGVDRFAKLMEASRRAMAEYQGGVVGIAPHSLRAVMPEELAAILPLAGEGPIHIHVAEQMKEVEDCIAWSGQRPVQWLLDHVPVDRRWCLIHATHMTSEETRAMAATGAVAGLCPVTEANLGDGTFNAPEFVGAGGHALFDGALAGGSQALGVTSGLAVGHTADIISLDADNLALAGRSGDAGLDSWIFGSAHSPVDCVWTLGRKVVTNGRHHQAESVAAVFRRRLEGLLAA